MAVLDGPRLAMVGSPSSGKTTLFNALTGLRATTGNPPGVTVSGYRGTTGVSSESGPPGGLLVTLDATTLRRSLGMLVRLLMTGIPLTVVLTFTDELARRSGSLDVAALRRALGVPW